ncbi:MAG: hypothetical protein VKL39_11340, partial [Leptolyngbyaceae bacterium]|nr:hypothetical protein [Leptolyngbyaceae bacterium]
MMGDRLFNQLLKWSPSGTLPWLLTHELRLWWRDLKAKWFLLIIGIISGIAILTITLSWFLISVVGEQSLLTIPDPLPL